MLKKNKSIWKNTAEDKPVVYSWLRSDKNKGVNKNRPFIRGCFVLF